MSGILWIRIEYWMIVYSWREWKEKGCWIEWTIWLQMTRSSSKREVDNCMNKEWIEMESDGIMRYVKR